MSEHEDLEELVIDDTAYPTRLTRKFRERKPVVLADPRRLCAAVPGVVLEIPVEVGEEVRRGDTLIVQEAMKMQSRLLATVDGVVAEVAVKPGTRVAKGELLVMLHRPADG